MLALLRLAGLELRDARVDLADVGAFGLRNVCVAHRAQLGLLGYRLGGLEMRLGELVLRLGHLHHPLEILPFQVGGLDALLGGVDVLLHLGHLIAARVLLLEEVALRLRALELRVRHRALGPGDVEAGLRIRLVGPGAGEGVAGAALLHPGVVDRLHLIFVQPRKTRVVDLGGRLFRAMRAGHGKEDRCEKPEGARLHAVLPSVIVRIKLALARAICCASRGSCALHCRPVISILVTVVGLGLLIAAHEAGHLALARLLGMRVETFSIGFGPRIAGFRRGETDYRLSAFPLGGYCKIAGFSPDEPAARDPTDAGSYANKPAWRRVLVIAAGPRVDYPLALPLILLLYSTQGFPGLSTNPPPVGPRRPAAPARPENRGA